MKVPEQAPIDQNLFPQPPIKIPETPGAVSAPDTNAKDTSEPSGDKQVPEPTPAPVPAPEYIPTPLYTPTPIEKDKKKEAPKQVASLSLKNLKKQDRKVEGMSSKDRVVNALTKHGKT